MILHALALTARDLGVGLLAIVIGAIAGLLVILLFEAVVRRSDRHHLAAIERERARVRAELRAHERRRSEMRSYAARPTAAERWGGVV